MAPREVYREKPAQPRPSAQPRHSAGPDCLLYQSGGDSQWPLGQEKRRILLPSGSSVISSLKPS